MHILESGTEMCNGLLHAWGDKYRAGDLWGGLAQGPGLLLTLVLGTIKDTLWIFWGTALSGIYLLLLTMQQVLR